MAAPITHIVLANKIYDKLFSHLDKACFFLGTSFPDIRYIAPIGRQETHPEVNSIEDLANCNAFTTGVKLHALIDNIREDFLFSHNIYQYLEQGNNAFQTVKLFEDISFYDKINDWTFFINIFGDPVKEELESGIDPNIILKWHSTLKKYLLKTPDTESVSLFLQAIGVPKYNLEETFREIKNIENIPKVRNYVDELYKNIEILLN